MSNRIPRSPFSTRLSGSAKETELRIRNIYQWKKKRPPVLLVVLTALTVLLCCGLVSCQPRQEVPLDDGNTASDHAQEQEKSTLLTVDGAVVEFPFLVPVGKEIRVDLNSDGVEERVAVCMESEMTGSAYKLILNGTDCTDTLERMGYYFDNPDPDYYAITDLDADDGMLEIALPDEGPSNDPITRFLRFDGSDLVPLGEVCGMVSRGNLTFDGAGTVASFMRLSVLQTWFAPVQWSIGMDDLFEPVAQELYDPYTFSDPDRPPVTALQELATYADRDQNSQRVPLPVGTQLTFLATDNVCWVQCAGPNGEQFWLHLEETSGYEVELYDGSYIYSGEAIAGLSMAD